MPRRSSCDPPTPGVATGYDAFYGVTRDQWGLYLCVHAGPGAQSVHGGLMTVIVRRLVRRDLSANNLVGSLPTSIGYLQGFITMCARGGGGGGGGAGGGGGNPAERASALITLFTLITLNTLITRRRNLANNRLSGSIPDSIGNLWNLLAYLCARQAGGATRALTARGGRNLAHNSLSGTIPADVGDLTSVTELCARRAVRGAGAGADARAPQGPEQ